MNLPAGFEARQAPNGRVYYVNHATQATSWDPPEVAVAQPVHTEKPKLVVGQPFLEVQSGRSPVVAARPVVPRRTPSHLTALPERPVVTVQGTEDPVVPYAAAPHETAPPPESKPAGVAKQFWSRTAALTKSMVIGPLAPSQLGKKGVLVLDGAEVWVELSKGILTIYDKPKEFILFRAPLKFIAVVADGATRRTVRHQSVAENEIALYVDPELMNYEADDQNSGWMPFGFFDHLRVGAQAPETALSAPRNLQRQNFSLFAPTPSDKQSWRITLNTAANSLRNWAYAKHELSDSLKYISGKKK